MNSSSSISYGMKEGPRNLLGQVAAVLRSHTRDSCFGSFDMALETYACWTKSSMILHTLTILNHRNYSATAYLRLCRIVVYNSIIVLVASVRSGLENAFGDWVQGLFLGDMGRYVQGASWLPVRNIFSCYHKMGI